MATKQPAKDAVKGSGTGTATGSETNLAKAVNEFSVDLLKAVANESPTENLFFSPLSVSSCLSMVLLGSKGQTESQLFRGLRWDVALKQPLEVHEAFKKILKLCEEDKSKAYALYIANRVLLHKDAANPVVENYKNSLTSCYQAVVEDVDFTKDGLRVQEECNRFVNEKTKGNIKSLLDSPPDQATRAIILNAIYFKGKWANPFDSQASSPAKFYNHGNEAEVKDGVSFMHHRDEDFNLAKEMVFGGEKAQMLEIPYKGDMSMFIILPEKKDGLKRMIPKMTYAQVEASLQETYLESVNVTLPKFKFDTNYKLNSTLIKLGITDAFCTKADLSGINGARNLLISEVVHKAAVNCDEMGTEASAATMARAMMMCMKYSAEFRADHPFFFFIRENKSKMILFMGVINKF